MNKAQILETADKIEKMPHIVGNEEAYKKYGPPAVFDMNSSHCGSAACIGGLVQWEIKDWDSRIEEAVAIHFEVPLYQANAICYPDSPESYTEITPQQAADMLRRLAETGEVDWRL